MKRQDREKAVPDEVFPILNVTVMCQRKKHLIYADDHGTLHFMGHGGMTNLKALISEGNLMRCKNGCYAAAREVLKTATPREYDLSYSGRRRRYRVALNDRGIEDLVMWFRALATRRTRRDNHDGSQWQYSISHNYKNEVVITGSSVSDPYTIPLLEAPEARWDQANSWAAGRFNQHFSRIKEALKKAGAKWTRTY